VTPRSGQIYARVSVFELAKNNWGVDNQEPTCGDGAIVCVTVYVILQHSTFEMNHLQQYKYCRVYLENGNSYVKTFNYMRQ
jgi:hypothetical protein